MSVYPIEISEKLQCQLQIPATDSQSVPVSPSFDIQLEDEIEGQWIEAVLSIESGDRDAAYSLLSNIESKSNQSLESIAKASPLNLHQQVLIASYAERLLLKPINYITDKKRLSLLGKLTQQLPEQRLKARLCHGLAVIMLWRRESKHALEYLFQARDTYTRLNEQSGEAMIADTLGNVFVSLADHQQALLFYSESLALKTHIADQKGRAITLGNLARLCLQLGRYEQAEKFAKLDLALCETEPANTRARVINLLARIKMASGAWDKAESLLLGTLDLSNNIDEESLFFCQKDLLLLKVEQGKVLRAEELSSLQEYLGKLSPYHQLLFDIVRHKAEFNSDKLKFDDAENTLAAIQSKNLPELEIDFRIWLSKAAFEMKRLGLAKVQLLLARKLAKKFGFKRFAAEITSIMLQHDVHESIVEETQRAIVETIEQVGEGYLIRKKLGTGGFGSVYQAHDMILDRDVALKQFRIQDLWDFNEFQNLWNQVRIEFEAVASINHPAIAKAYALGHDNFGTPYLVQEYLTGGELRNLMNEPQNLQHVLTYLIPIVQGLAVIHKQGVIHRDLKPENILLNAQGMPVIVDFGIAILKQSSNANQRISGTPDYMAPEQLESASIDHRADLYSIGCILFEWLSGKTPNASVSKTAGLVDWLRSTPKFDFDQDIFGQASDLLRSLLHQNPAKRPKDAVELLVQLKALRNE
ncbi:MAG: protein kinase [Kangiellaceae bacterium]